MANKIPKEFAEMLEHAYRRGYHHAWHYCVERVADGCCGYELEEYLDSIRVWRDQPHNGKMSTPPGQQAVDKPIPNNDKPPFYGGVQT